jgi:thiol-disulfide isomerase/thioredoxin
MKNYLITFIFSLLSTTSVFSQTFTKPAKAEFKEGIWQGSLLREDGFKIPIKLQVETKGSQQTIYVVNGTERLAIEAPVLAGDSIVLNMPVFESFFKVKHAANELTGYWIKGGSNKSSVIPFEAHPQTIASLNKKTITASNKAKSVKGNLTGKWDLQISKPDQSKRPAIGNFVQKGTTLTGSVLTPTGDYRYMAGTVFGDSLQLSTFDGVHALSFTGKVSGEKISGKFYSGLAPSETWTAVQNDKVALEAPITTVKEGSDGKLDFKYLDLEGREVSLNSGRYRNKVVVVQLMGSWCPNCMDEMAFLSDYYSKNKSRGVEVIALAYELTTDTERSRKSLQKFQKQFKVEYPILNTGVTVGDKERTDKTLPQITEIKVFPTSIILDKKGTVKEINTAFYGPGTGEYYQIYKNKFERTINALLAEK